MSPKFFKRHIELTCLLILMLFRPFLGIPIFAFETMTRSSFRPLPNHLLDPDIISERVIVDYTSNPSFGECHRALIYSNSFIYLLYRFPSIIVLYNIYFLK